MAVQPRHAWFNNSTLTRRVLTLSGHWPRSESASAFGFARAWELYSAFTIPDFNWPDDTPRARLEGRPELPVSSFGTCLEGRPWSISTIHISNHFDPLHSHLKKLTCQKCWIRDGSARRLSTRTRTLDENSQLDGNHAEVRIQLRKCNAAESGQGVQERNIHQHEKCTSGPQTLTRLSV